VRTAGLVLINPSAISAISAPRIFVSTRHVRDCFEPLHRCAIGVLWYIAIRTHNMGASCSLLITSSARRRPPKWSRVEVNSQHQRTYKQQRLDNGSNEHYYQQAKVTSQRMTVRIQIPPSSKLHQQLLLRVRISSINLPLTPRHYALPNLRRAALHNAPHIDIREMQNRQSTSRRRLLEEYNMQWSVLFLVRVETLIESLLSAQR
jgi:hypothetical protein